MDAPRTSTTAPGLSWLSEADPSAFDELESGNSIWPTVMCGLSAPWFVLARIAARLSFKDREVTVMLGLLYFAVFGVCGAVLESVAFVEAGVVVHLAYIAGICLLTLLLRRRLRAQYNIPGSTVVDAIKSVFPFSLWGLALVERDLRRRDEAKLKAARTGAPKSDLPPATPASQPPPPSNPATATGANPPPVGTWQSDLGFCYPDGCPIFQCAAAFPWFIMTRIHVRLGGGSKMLVAAGLFALYVGSITVGSVSETLMQDDFAGDAVYTVGVLCMLLAGCLELMTVLMTAKLRHSVRQRYGITGNIAKDVLLSAFCRPCVLQQMEHQTQPLVRDLEAAAGQEEIASGASAATPAQSPQPTMASPSLPLPRDQAEHQRLVPLTPVANEAYAQAVISPPSEAPMPVVATAAPALVAAAAAPAVEGAPAVPPAGSDSQSNHQTPVFSIV